MNEQNIEELINSLYDFIQDAKSLPLSADKCMLERDKALEQARREAQQIIEDARRAANAAAEEMKAIRKQLTEAADTQGINQRQAELRRNLNEAESKLRAAQPEQLLFIRSQKGHGDFSAGQGTVQGEGVGFALFESDDSPDGTAASGKACRIPPF